MKGYKQKLMKKKYVFLIFVIASILILLMVLFKFLDFNLKSINNAYKDIRLEELINDIDNNFKIRDESGYCNKSFVWVGVVVEDNISYEDIKKKIKKIYGADTNYQCKPYDISYANKNRFTGIQKELFSSDGNMLKTSDGIYFIYKTYKPIFVEKD